MHKKNYLKMNLFELKLVLLILTVDSYMKQKLQLFPLNTIPPILAIYLVKTIKKSI